MKFKINSHCDTYVKWIYDGQQGQSDVHEGDVQDTYITSQAFDLTTPVERMISAFVQAWLDMRTSRFLKKDTVI